MQSIDRKLARCAREIEAAKPKVMSYAEFEKGDHRVRDFWYALEMAGALNKTAKELAADGDGWIEWKGGDCPVPTGTMVEVRYRDQEAIPSFIGPANENVDPTMFDAGPAFWRHNEWQCDIVAYRLVK